MKYYKMLAIRRILFLFLYIIFFQCNVYSQSFKSGFILGVNATQMDGDKMEGFNKTGIRFGVYTMREFKPNFTYKIEIMYSRKGSRNKADTNGIFDPGTAWDLAKLNYIEIPLILGWQWKTKVKIEAGLTSAYLFNHSVERFNSTGIYYTDSAFKKSEFGFQFGANFKLNDNWSLSGRYHTSIVSITQGDNQFFTSPRPGFLHRMFFVQINYELPGR